MLRLQAPARFARATVLVVNVRSEELSSSVKRELRKLEEHIHQLRLLDSAQNKQRECQELLRQEKDLQGFPDKVESALSKTQDQIERPMKEMSRDLGPT